MKHVTVHCKDGVRYIGETENKDPENDDIVMIKVSSGAIIGIKHNIIRDIIIDGKMISFVGVNW